MSQILRIGRYAFDAARALPAFNTAWADAFEAEPHPDYPAGVYALLLKSKLPARLDMFNAVQNTKIGSMQSVIEYDIVKIGGGQRLAFLIERPIAPPLMTDIKGTLQPQREDHIRIALIRPLIQTLAGLHERGLSHGSVSPFTIFAKPDLSALMLGECTTGLPGAAQPALFEQIERVQCNPVAKGDASIEDDIFALGVTAWMLMIGKNPFAEMPDEELLRRRQEIGTTALLLNHAKLPAGLMEFIRGVCSDMPKQRWNLQEIESWAGGNRVQLHSAGHPPPAARSITVDGQEFVRARPLATELIKRPALVRKLIESKELQRWLQRSLGNHDISETATAFIEKASINNMSDELLTARMAIILDPQGPVRYKSVALMPQGMGSALARAAMEKDADRQQLLCEVLSHDLIGHWIRQPGNGTAYYSMLAREVEQAREYLVLQGMGYGPERALYELQANAPCYSEMFLRYYVSSPRQMLPALDEMAADGRRPPEPVDRHIAAFVGARLGRGNELLFTDLAAGKDAARRSVAILNLLATVQSRYNSETLPRLCAWVAETLKPAIDRFHSRQLRQLLQKNLNKFASQGDLMQLQHAIDSVDVVESDLRGFRNAIQQYQNLNAQIREVNILLENKTAVGLAVGQRLAAGLSVAIGLMATAAAILQAVK